MIHDLDTTPHGEQFRHKCRLCGMEKITRTPKWFGACLGPECIHLGNPTDETVTCKGCPGSPRVHTVWTCAVHGGCLPTVRKKTVTTPAVHKCQGCEERAAG